MNIEIKDQILEAMEAFPFPGVIVDVVKYGNGHVHSTYCLHVQTKDERRCKYILQKINHFAFKDPVGLMSNITKVTDYLREKAVGEGEDPKLYLTVMRTITGESFFLDSNQEYWRVYPFIENSTSYDKVISKEQFYESAKAFGNFQKQLSEFDASSLHMTIERFHDTKNRLELLDKAIELDLLGRVSEVAAEIEMINQRRDKASYLLDLYDAGELPLRVTHNDTKLNNVLFDKDTGSAIAVIDLDTVMPGLSAFDFGDAIRFGCNRAAEDEKDLSKVQFDRELYDVFVKGFLEGTDGALTRKEIEVLPYGAYIMTFENAVRFLTDYIDGDKYFHIERPEHNLDRTRTQLKFVQEMEKHWADMQIAY